MNLLELSEKFYNSRRLNGAAERTVIDYISFVHKFVLFVGVDKSASDITVDNFDEYKLYLLGSAVSRTTCRTYLAHVRVFLRWAVGEGYINFDVSELSLPRSDSKLLDVLTDDEVKILLGAVEGDSFLDCRNRLIVYLMLDCGFRLGDVLNLKEPDIRDGYFFLNNGKGNKSRVVPFGSAVGKALSDYCSFGVYDSRAFILTRNLDPITVDSIKKLFFTLKRSTGINRLHAHLLRHTFATNYIYNGGNLEMLRAILGHTDISTTQIYCHLSDIKKLMSGACVSYLDRVAEL